MQGRDCEISSRRFCFVLVWLCRMLLEIVSDLKEWQPDSFPPRSAAVGELQLVDPIDVPATYNKLGLVLVSQPHFVLPTEPLDDLAYEFYVHNV